MDYARRLSISYYKTVAPINEAHNVDLVRHPETGRFFVRKTLDVYTASVYEQLRKNPVQGIPEVIDFCEENGRLILIEEFISGRTLREILDESRMPRTEEAGGQGPARYEGGEEETSFAGNLLTEKGAGGNTLTEKSAGGNTLTAEKIGHYMISLCEVLQRLHSMDPPIIHRDIKPSNIIIGGYGDAYLLDYNAARNYRTGEELDMDTRLLGTQGYAAPEQYGFGQSSMQTDIYSLGKILSECAQYLPPEDHTFDRVIQKCTQMDPAKRYSSADRLRAALQKCLGIGDRADLTGKVVNPYLPPGFRTLNPLKMIIASAVYLMIFYVSLTLEANDLTGAGLWFQRICVLVVLLTGVMVGTNYLNTQSIAPFHDSGSRFLRIAGAVLLMLSVTGMMFLLTVIMLSFFVVK